MSGTYQYKDSSVVICYMRFCQGVGKCICCNKPVTENDSAALLINNHKYFPNMLLHRTCLDHLEGNDHAEEKMQKLFQECEEKYQKYHELQQYFSV